MKAGDEVLAVVPEPKSFIGKVFLSATSSGKVRSGQRVRIKFDHYPSSEYGFVEGAIDRISATSFRDQYIATIDLENGLLTSMHNRLRYLGEMNGTVEIVTEENSILSKLIRGATNLIREMTY